jgi:hypothetical protein
LLWGILEFSEIGFRHRIGGFADTFNMDAAFDWETGEVGKFAELVFCPFSRFAILAATNALWLSLRWRRLMFSLTINAHPAFPRTPLR